MSYVYAVVDYDGYESSSLVSIFSSRYAADDFCIAAQELSDKAYRLRRNADYCNPTRLAVRELELDGWDISSYALELEVAIECASRRTSRRTAK